MRWWSRAGRRLMPAEMGLLASLGIGEIAAYRRLRVAYFSTGDEIRPPGAPFEPGLVYDSNRFTMHGMLGRIAVDVVDLGIVPDRRDAVRDAFREASTRADVVLSSGGASTGEADYVKEVLSELGQVGFWRIAIRPGRPLAFGFLGDSVFFGLPGNPVAVMGDVLPVRGARDSRGIGRDRLETAARARSALHHAAAQEAGPGRVLPRGPGTRRLGRAGGAQHRQVGLRPPAHDERRELLHRPPRGRNHGGTGRDGRRATLLRPDVSRELPHSCSQALFRMSSCRTDASFRDGAVGIPRNANLLRAHVSCEPDDP